MKHVNSLMSLNALASDHADDGDARQNGLIMTSSSDWTQRFINQHTLVSEKGRKV